MDYQRKEMDGLLEGGQIQDGLSLLLKREMDGLLEGRDGLAQNGIKDKERDGLQDYKKRDYYYQIVIL